MGARLTDPNLGPDFDETAYRAQQRRNANVTALILLGFVVLFFFITIAKLGLAT